MTVNKSESKTLKVVLEMLNRRFLQVCLQDSDEPDKQTTAQIHAYTIAMGVINNIDEEIRHYLNTGEIKECPIIFDEEGRIYNNV